MSIIETRDVMTYVEAETLELRAEAGSDPVIGGYAARWNSPSKDLGGFVETILPGAFKASLASPREVRVLVSHDPQKLVARTGNKSLKVWEDDKGLRFEATVPAGVSYADDLLGLMQRGLFSKCSFGFLTPRGGDTFETVGGKTTRTIKTADLYEISVVATPAFDATNVSIRIDPDVLRHAKESGSQASMLNRARRLRITSLKG